MGRFAVALNLCLGIVLADASAAWACSLGPDPAFENFSPQSSEVPPAVEVVQISVDLGRSYGGPGPGDCSELGSVEIELNTADGAPLDDRFGARLTLVSGSLPVVFVEDLTTTNFPIVGNRVRLTIVDRHNPNLAFSVVVQLVNAQGELGTGSTQMSAEEPGGCTATGTHGSRSSVWLAVLGAGFAFMRLRSSRQRSARGTQQRASD